MKHDISRILTYSKKIAITYLNSLILNADYYIWQFHSKRMATERVFRLSEYTMSYRKERRKMCIRLVSSLSAYYMYLMTCFIRFNVTLAIITLCIHQSTMDTTQRT